MEQVLNPQDQVPTAPTPVQNAPAPPPGPVLPNGQPNKARWGAAKSPEPSPNPDAATSPEPDAKPVQESAEAPAETPQDTAPTPALDNLRVAQDETSGVNAVFGAIPDMPLEESGDAAVGEEELPEGGLKELMSKPSVLEEQPEPQPKTRRHTRGKNKKAPPRPEELVTLPNTGEKYEGVEIVSTKDHGDGGRLLVLADGWRIKLDKKGKVAAKIEGMPPEPAPEDTKSGEELEAEAQVEDDDKFDDLTMPPKELMETTSARNLIKWIHDNGVTDPEDIVQRCIELKAAGAVALQQCKDDDGVRRRANLMLGVLGLASPAA